MKTIFNILLENEMKSPKIQSFIDRYTESSLGIPRSKMPQLDDSKIDEYVSHFASKYKLKKVKMPVGSLLPMQNEIDPGKVQSMDVKAEDCRFFASKDNRIIDGHHRHVKLLHDDKNQEVTVYKTNLTPEKLRKVFRHMKSTTVAEGAVVTSVKNLKVGVVYRLRHPFTFEWMNLKFVGMVGPSGYQEYKFELRGVVAMFDEEEMREEISLSHVSVA